jgi:hypothetical protein
MKRRRGWVFVDVVMGLILLGLSGTMLVVAANWHYRLLKHLADSRAATRLAESELISLQAGEPVDQGKFAVHQLPTASGSPGMQWVEVSATVDGRGASLVGLVPASAVHGGVP